MDLCLDVLARTSPAPLGVFQPWSCTPAPLFFPTCLTFAHAGSGSAGGWTPRPGSPFPAPSSSEPDARLSLALFCFSPPMLTSTLFFPGVRGKSYAVLSTPCRARPGPSLHFAGPCS